jgi:hypothetical protein
MASVLAGVSRKGGGSGVNEAASFLAVPCGVKIAMSLFLVLFG